MPGWRADLTDCTSLALTPAAPPSSSQPRPPRPPPQYWGELSYFRIVMGGNQLGLEGSCNWATPAAWTEHNTACYEDGTNCVKTATYTDPSETL